MALKDLINKSEKECVFSDITFKVKQYLSLKDKVTLIRTIVSGSFFEDENGNEYCDSIYRELFKLLNIVDFYTTGIKLPMITMEDDKGNKDKVIDIFKSYDVLVSNGLLEKVLSEIPESEIKFIEEHLEQAIWDKETTVSYSKSIEGLVKKFFENIQAKIPENMDEVIKNTINELKSEKFIGILKNITGITRWNNGETR
jgi:hypothetical protein